MADADRPERPTRVDVNIAARLTTSGGHCYRVVVRDLSANGFRIALEDDDEVIVGERVSLKVGAQDPMIGEINWALGREAGGHFIDEVPDLDSGGCVP